MATTLYSEIMRLAPLRYYPLASATDASSNAQNGAVQGTITFGQTPIVKASTIAAALPNGTSGYMTIPTTGLPTGAGAWTFGCWVRTGGSLSGAYQALLHLGHFGGANGAGLRVAIDSGNSLQIGDAGFTVNVTSSSVAINTTYCVVATYDGTTARLYVNGASIGGVVYTFALTSDVAWLFNDEFNSYFKSTCAHAFLLNSALSADRINWLYAVGLGAGGEVRGAHKTFGRIA